VLREQLGSILCTQNSLVLFERIFGVPFRLTTVFLSSFWSVFLLSFSKEGRKMRGKYIKNYTQNIRFDQI